MKKNLLILILAIILAVFFVIFWVWQGIYLPKEPNSEKEVFFEVKKGEGTKEILINLERQGLIKYGSLFRLYTLTRGVAGRLQAGEYLLSPAMTIPQIAKKIALGDVIEFEITIPEGSTIAQIEEKLNEKLKILGWYKNGELQLKIKNFTVSNFKEDFGFLAAAPDKASLEGYLFPDTYQFSFGERPDEVLRKMLKNFDKKLAPDLKEEIRNQGKTIFEIVTMASLIEKEVRSPEDKKLVSGILWKRLKSGIPLQVDATISYITGKRTTEISIEETKIDSPYNTYKNLGLPPGPISNPGLESILASVYPKDSDYWYYLSTPATEGEPRPNGREGETIFSKTLEEHNIAKAKYLK